MTSDLTPFAGTVGGGFFIGFITGYANKKVIKLAAITVGLFIAALAYLEYQRILNVDWYKVQAISQNGIDWVTDALTHVSSTIGASHSETLSYIAIPLVSSVSAGFAVGCSRMNLSTRHLSFVAEYLSELSHCRTRLFP
jgi:uncharacterized membrane protein (Fun14 family)